MLPRFSARCLVLTAPPWIHANCLCSSWSPAATLNCLFSCPTTNSSPGSRRQLSFASPYHFRVRRDFMSKNPLSGFAPKQTIESSALAACPHSATNLPTSADQLQLHLAADPAPTSNSNNWRPASPSIGLQHQHSLQATLARTSMTHRGHIYIFPVNQSTARPGLRSSRLSEQYLNFRTCDLAVAHTNSDYRLHPRPWTDRFLLLSIRRINLRLSN